MARILDLDKVKQAWQLRREGKQQKEIAEVLDLSLRHTQNYLSLDWLAQRSMKVLMKGRAEEANDQLRALWGLGQETKQDSAARADTVAEADERPDGEIATGLSQPCPAPEQWPDVGHLEGWGVPKYAAPGLLSAWRRAHREEGHELCALWADLTENVQAKIPFPDAYDLAMASWLADRWSFGSLKTVIELYRLYRPWEGKIHRRVYLDEVHWALQNVSSNGATGEIDRLFEGLPRRFFYGLPRRYSQEGKMGVDNDDDDDDDDDD